MATATTPITSSSANAATTGTTSTAGLSGISGDDFMNILVKQLQMQDPFQPMTNQEMVQQLSTIRQLEMNTAMSTNIEQLTDQQRFGSAASLIGKKVHGQVKDANGNAFDMDGIVTGLQFTDKGDVMLSLDSGQTLPLTSLQTVTNASGSAASATSAANASTNATARTAKARILQRLLK